MSIGTKLRELRGDKTQEQVANAIGVTKSAYAMYERDERVPRDNVKKIIANYYNTTVSIIFFDQRAFLESEVNNVDEIRNGIRQRRIALGWTQEELANMVGLQKATISRYESGKIERIHAPILDAIDSVLTEAEKGGDNMKQSDGDRLIFTTKGNYGSAAAGNYGSAAAGDRGSAAAGNYGSAVSRGSVSVEKNGIAIARDNGIKAKGGLGSIILLAEEFEHSYEIKCWKFGIVDGETLKPDTWYTLKDGEIVEVKK